jgi:ketosteroid isomerase-like protein
MSGQANADKLQGLWDTFDAEGAEGAARMIGEVYDPDVEFNPLQAESAGGRTYRGLDGVIAFFGELDEAFSETHYEPPQFHPVGDDLVVVLTRLVGMARDTGLPLRQDLSLVYEFNEAGRAQRVTAYETPADALEAAQRGHADA